MADYVPDESPSNRVVFTPERDPVPRPLVPAPLGADSSTSIADTILSVVRQTGQVIVGFTQALPDPVLEALIHRSERGHPATDSPQIRAVTAADQAQAIATPRALAGVPITLQLAFYLALGWLAYRVLR